MRLKRLFFLFFLIFFARLTAIADTFTVTSNVDSGPGTLREAITMANANGTNVLDYIHFNIADISINGRTITLQSSLPFFTSKIILDASTQPGTQLGLSGSKVVLQMLQSTNINEKLFVIHNCDSVEVYGLKIYDGINHFYSQETYCFDIINSDNIKIGAVGKGNVLINWTHGIKSYNDSPDRNKNISVKSNIIGLFEDGATEGYVENSLIFHNIENLEIGGVGIDEGNIIACSRRRINLSGTKGNILIANNIIGANYTGTIERSLPYRESNHLHYQIYIANSPYFYEIEYQTDIKILNNLITGTSGAGIYLLGFGNKFYIQGNKIGTEISGTTILNSSMDYGVLIENCRKGIVGVDNNDLSEKNIIAYAKRGSSGATYQAGSAVSVANGRGVTISRNSIFCDENKGINFDVHGAYLPSLITINRVSSNLVSGTASPYAKIELFQDDTCINCEGKIYIDSALADANGNWSKSNINTNNIVATATDTSGQTSEFSSPKFLVQNLQIKNSTCGQNNGEISGISIISGTRWQWIDVATNNIISTDTILRNISAGTYKLIIGIGSNNCDISTQDFVVTNVSPPSSITSTILASSCGLNNGSISINTDLSYFNSKWMNAIYDSIGTGLLINNILPGIYYYKIWATTDTSCNRIYGPFTVINQSGPSLNINNIQITSATCTNANGSIRNIISSNVTGTPFIQWLDSLNTPVGNMIDLQNVTAGKYKLKFKDQSGCDTIITPFYIIPATGQITIDTTGKNIIHGGCAVNNGAIRNITVTGGANFQWQNLTTNTPAGNTLLISNLSPGNYQLTATNTTGCTAVSPIIIVPQSTFTPISVTNSQIQNAFCGAANGSVRITAFSNDSNYYSFVWLNNATNQQIGNGTAIGSINEGAYLLFATDTNGCKKQIFSATVSAFNKPVIDLASIKTSNDRCSQLVGSITGIKVTGQSVTNTTYTWRDAGNNIVGTSTNLINMGAGQYYLTVTDGINCTVQTGLISINNINDLNVIPQYDNLLVLKNTIATLRVKNHLSGTYILYSDIAGTQVLQQNTSGIFTTSPLTSDIDFYIRFVSGSCITQLTKVSVTVVDKSFFAIPSAFTPNNDGLNDKLTLKVVGHIDVDYFRIYNRNGELVFSTKKINYGWNGHFKGIPQPSGVFVWVASGKDINGNSMSNKGTFILIRE
jgi:gliding motility-associated-like protein